MEVIIDMPLTEEKVKNLKVGDKVFISGEIYTLRDAGHKKLLKQIESGEKLPIDLNNKIIYYAGPSPAKPGEVIGSAGPTTSYRMDVYTPPLLELGLKGMIGKGDRSEQVIDSMKKNKAVYFAAVGGAAALIANCIKEVTIVAYEELGTEALRKIKVEKLPVTVAIDCEGNNIYKTERKKYNKFKHNN